MDPVASVPEEEPRADATQNFRAPGTADTPEQLSATRDFERPAPPPRNPFATLTAGDSPPRDGPPPLDSIRLSVPGYEILSELGRGGMGVVYLARQIGLNRPVALKMILSGEHAGTAERERFRREAEAVAALQHANIVQIYDIGEAQGRPYLAFEYVSGGSLAALLGGQPWPAKPAGELVETLARAMQFAHDRNIVHRDLKPANVLFTADSGLRPGEALDHTTLKIPQSALKITDFGLAKRLEPQSSWSGDSERTAPVAHTRTGAVIGTPSYLAPEQAAGKNRTVGPHADIYALGAILYELLTGRPPFRGETALDTVLQVMSDDPVPPSKLRSKLPRDLETICLKCLQKDPRKRYESAGRLADDLMRFRRGEAITARPVGRWERGVKWTRRHPAATAMALVSALALTMLFGVSVYFNVRLRLAADRIEGEAKAARDAQALAESEKQRAEAKRIEAENEKAAADLARREAEAKKREADRGVYALQLFKAAALGERDPQRALRLLDDRNRCPEEFRDFTWRYIRGQFLVTESVVGVHQGGNGTPPVAHVAHSPDGSMVATVSGIDPLVRIYDVAGRRPLYILAGHKLAAHGVAFSPDGRTVATGGADNTVLIWQLPDKKPVRPTQLEPIVTLPGHTNTVTAVVFAPDGKKLASAGADSNVRIWEMPAGAGKDGMRPLPAGVLKEHIGPVLALAWSDAGLFSGGADGRVLLWRLTRGGGRHEELFKLKKQALALAASPDGELIAAAGDAEADDDEPIIQLYRPLTDKKAGILRGHTGLAIYDLSFSPDGKRLASAGRDGTVRVWDVAGLQERGVFRPERGARGDMAEAFAQPIRGVSFGVDGVSIVSGGQDGAVRHWVVAGQREEAVELGVRPPVAAAALSADGGILAVAEKVSRQIKLWRLGDLNATLEPKPARLLLGLERAPNAIAVNEDGSAVAAATPDGVFVWRGDDRPVRIAREPAIAVALSGGHVVFATDDGQLKWLNLSNGRQRYSLLQSRGRSNLVVFSSDGTKLVSAGGTSLQVWDAATGDLLYHQLLAHLSPITAVAVRPGDTGELCEIATADERGLVKVWELRPRSADDSQAFVPGSMVDVKQRPSAAGLNDSIGSLSFTTDGRTLASGGVDRAIRLRDPFTGQERAALAGHTDVVLLLAFRADQVMISVGREGFVRLWRAARG